ncbi:MAG: hypothetical protein AB1631_12780 [Acidobacteriota bacterium]
MEEIFEIQAARDRRTGFPVLRLSDNDSFVSLFPVMKLQAEQWIWEGGLRHTEAYLTTLLIERMERMEQNHAPQKYPESLKKLLRAPISEGREENLPGLIATNLTLWNSDDEITRSDVRFPTPTSEWGRLIRWAGGSVPSYFEWTKARERFNRFRTKDIINSVLRLGFPLAPAIQFLMQKFTELISEEERGLPFINLGLYELISNAKEFQKITEDPPVTLWRPQVAGESALWPTVESREVRWRPVLQQHLPVVTARLWYEESQVSDSQPDGGFNHFRLAADTPLVEEPDAMETRRSRSTGALNSYRSSRVTMENRCPVCYHAVPVEVFQNDAGLWCYLEATQASSDDDDEKIQGVRSHSNTRPPRRRGFVQVEAVHREYLTVARRDPSKIRSVCLSGWKQSGKTTWLLSLWGLMTFPQGNSRLPRAFPSHWGFDQIKCSLLDFISGEDLINIFKQTEAMWIDGDLPIRTTALTRALRCPVLFKIARRITPLWTSRRQIILNFNDIAGELMTKPADLPNNEDYPNISTTTDVIFLAPAHQIHNASQFLEIFAGGLGAVEFNGKAIDTRQINLILAISQIDRLRHSPDADAASLLEILMRPPYTLPDNQQAGGSLEEYCAAMKQVHFDLQSLLESRFNTLTKVASRFASVRYCGFSAFGFQPVMEGKKAKVEACLPFEPQPVRVADPLLWLLSENGLIDF